MATYNTTKWVETKALQDNTIKNIPIFLYKHITTYFGCPIYLETIQGNHFINQTIEIITKKFMIKTINQLFITYKVMGNPNQLIEL
jgi:hypothetical protein